MGIWAQLFSRFDGLHPVAQSVDCGMRTMLLRQGEVQILLSNGPGTQEVLDAHGDGIADIALACDDIGATREAPVASGARIVGDVAGCPVVSGFGSVRPIWRAASGVPRRPDRVGSPRVQRPESGVPADPRHVLRHAQGTVYRHERGDQ